MTMTTEKFAYIDTCGILMGPYDTLEEAEQTAAEDLGEVDETITVFLLQPRLKVILKPATEEIEADEEEPEVEEVAYELNEA